MKLKAVALSAYTIVALLTGGHYYNHRCGERSQKMGMCGVDAWYVGSVWPVYWAVRCAVEVTK